MHVTLREITSDTVYAVTKLAVAPGQERFVARAMRFRSPKPCSAMKRGTARST